MVIQLWPIAGKFQDSAPFLNGDFLTYRGETYDLSTLPEGAKVEAKSPFIGNITRQNGEIFLTLEYRYHKWKAEDRQSTDWADYTFNVTNGKCPDPIRYKPVTQEPENVD